jgi:hypothetical protein
MDPRRAPIESLQGALGAALDEAIDRQGGKVAFARRAGLNRATLYRLLRGQNVSTDVLLRVLRELGRFDLIASLIEPPEPSPLERRPAKRRRSRADRELRPAPSGSLVGKLALGRPPSLEGDDG